MPASSRLASLAVLFLLWFFWGTNWVVTKIGLAEASAFQLALGRTLLALITLAAIMVASGRSLRPTPLWPTFWLGLTQTAGFVLLTNLALVAGGAGKVSVLCYTMPFWTLLLARLWLHERLAWPQWLGVLLAFAGLMLILEPWALGSSWLSDLLAIAGGLVWALSVIVAKKLRLAHRVDTLGLTFWQMMWGTVPLVLLAPFFPGQPLTLSWTLVGVLLFSGVLAGGLGWWMWMTLLARLSAGMAGLNILAIPAVAVLMAWLWLGEHPSSSEAAGMGLIALALLLLSLYTVWRDRSC
ncbi:EamA-like transporter family [Gulbenkiania indica]|uniref:EamA-like transporter family n=1 Tax=Gulbenkiania indica TaxID=375574 RepID=A0A0K6H6I1_9NEIS|nr:DMT family transporter [Gulbenkiania indica]CUA86571.1 EamA-like transporter family [Gulbenkiania indica]